MPIRKSLLVALVASLSACASGQVLPTEGAGPDSASEPDSPEENPADSEIPERPWDPTAKGGGECSELTGFVHVVSTGGDLYSFWPPTRQFHKLGHIDCATFETPLSMAIDRAGTAHVLFWDGTVHDVDLLSGACTPSGAAGETFAYHYFGMAFATDRSSATGESLFVREAIFYEPGQDPLSRRLGRLDLAASSVHTLGEGDGANADLTGTGDGRLFAFVKNPDGKGSVTELDPKTGAALTVDVLDEVTLGDSWAFASWGGDLWLFSSQSGVGTAVFQYRPETGTTTLVANETDFRVIGAGVSSCVPVAPPH